MTKEEFTSGLAHWDSHRKLLWEALEATTGPVVEFGMGDGSTPFLSAYCQERNRELISYENNKEWFEQMNGKFPHPMHMVTDWDDVQINSPSVLFIDHAPGERRKIDIQRFALSAQIIVIHDSEVSADHGYQLSTIWHYFKYRIDDPGKGTGTTAVSNFIDVSKWVL